MKKKIIAIIVAVALLTVGFPAMPTLRTLRKKLSSKPGSQLKNIKGPGLPSFPGLSRSPATW